MQLQADRSTSSGQSRVLVTGGAGFIGRHLLRRLLREQRVIRVLDLPGTSLPADVRDAVEFCHGDVRNPDDVAAAMQDCCHVVHLAADPNLWHRDADHFDAVNRLGTQHVLDAAQRLGVKRLVHVSTESILSRPRGQRITDDAPLIARDAIGRYCQSKLAAEQLAVDAAKAGLPVTIVSPTVPVGPGDERGNTPLGRTVRAYVRGDLGACFLDGQINLIDVRDVAEGIVACLRSGAPGRRYLLAAETWTIRRLLTLATKYADRPPPRFAVPYAAALAFAWLEQLACRFTGKQPFATVTGVRLTRRSFDFVGDASRNALGLTYRSCAASLEEMVDGMLGDSTVDPTTTDEASVSRATAVARTDPS